MKKQLLSIFIFLAMLLPLQLLAGDIKIIVNKSVKEKGISKSDIKKIFLGKKSKWNSGGKIVLVTLKKGSDVHRKFLKTYVKKNPSQFANFWKRNVFTGKGKMPKSLKSEVAMVKYVSSKENAVGYITSGTSINNAKILIIQ